MKKLLVASLLALAVVAGSQQRASAWGGDFGLSFGIGFSIGVKWNGSCHSGGCYGCDPLWYSTVPHHVNFVGPYYGPWAQYAGYGAGAGAGHPTWTAPAPTPVNAGTSPIGYEAGYQPVGHFGAAAPWYWYGGR